MNGGFYQSKFKDEDIQIITPDTEKQKIIHSMYFEELVKGIFKAESKEILINIINKINESEQIDGVILGGTELPLILKENDFENIKLLNTTELHINELLNSMNI